MFDQTLWAEVCADAGVAHLTIEAYPYDTPRPNLLPVAAYVQPGTFLIGPEAAVLSPSQRQQINTHVDRHRILIATAESPDVLAALLRHELEHVRQNEAGGSRLFVVYEATMAGVDIYVGADRRGSAVLYNIVPPEMDANAAAARFMRTRLEPDRLDELSASAHGVLFRPQPPPGPVETVGARTVCFASLAADRVERWLEDDPRADRSTLDGVAGISGFWGRLRVDQQLRRLSSAAMTLIPGAASLDVAEPDVRTAWQPLRDQLLDAYAYARSIASV